MKQTIKQVFGILLFAMLSLSGFAQQANVTIKGTVKDNAGVLLPGVNIIEKGTKNAVTTDFDGKYSLTVNKGAVLVFSYLGMKTVSKTVGNEPVMDVSMVDGGDTSLKEVVVVGYGAQKKGHLTGAAPSIKAAEIEDLPTNSLATALVGRVLGVGVSGGSARPGAVATIKIRNPQVFSKDGGTTNPLYVIDGVLQVSGDGSNDTTLFDNLDASEVESLTFLKDGSAAIYGARSANGVVIVTTKRGKKGEARFTYSGAYGTEDETYRTKMLSAYDYARYYDIMNGPNGNNAAINGKYFFSDDEKEYFKTLNYNPLGDEWHASSNQKHALNVSGGTERATYFAGGSYYTQGGNLSNVDYSKWNFRSGADFNISNNFKAGIQISGFLNDISKTNSRIGGTNDENDYRRLLNWAPFMPQYINGLPLQVNTQGTYQYHYGEINRLGNKATTSGRNLATNFYVEYAIPFINGLKARVSYAINAGSTRGNYVGTKYTIYQYNGVGTNQHIYHNDGALFNDVALPNNTLLKANTYNNGNRLGWDNQNSNSQQSNFNLTYNRDFGKHSVSGLFSVEKGESNNTREEFYKDDPLQSTNGYSNTAFGIVDGTSVGNETGSLGYIGRFNYAYSDKYLFEMLYRSDASTRFSPENYWGKFYNLSAGWVISKENFFNSNVIDFLKIRYSFGQLGKDETKAWQWRQRFTFQGGKGIVVGDALASTGLKMEVTPNPDATWSQEIKNNLGIEAKFLKNRLSLTLEAFYNRGTEMLMSKTASVPFTVGGSVASENYGAVDFFGYEFSLGWNDKIGNDFRYGVDVNFGWSDNKVITSDFNQLEIMKPWVAQPGQSTDNGVWGHDYLGMFKSQADIDAYVAEYKITSVFGAPVANLRPGTLYYRDIRGPLNNATGEFAPADGKIDEWDQIQLADKKSTRYGTGTTFKVEYKSFSLIAVVTASFGGGWNEVDGSTRKAMTGDLTTIQDNRPAVWNDIYDPTLNPTGTMPNPYKTTNATLNINLDPTSTFWQRSATNIQMRNINLGYKMPAKYTAALGISSCRINFTALNPFILYNPFDYKNPNGAYDVYPTLKTYSLGVNLAF